MTHFILLNFIMLSMSLVLVLVIRALPRVEEDTEVKRGYLERLIASDIPHRLDSVMNTYAGKMMRRMKVVLLRWDNTLTEKIKRMSPEDSKKIDFKDIQEGEVAKNDVLENN